MTVADGLYWIVRDYYREKKSQKFINAFGYMLEDYFCELANRYLDKDQLKKYLYYQGNQFSGWPIFIAFYDGGSRMKAILHLYRI